MEIVSEMENITSVLLDNAQAYFIPEFQRNFVWGAKEIDQLIHDINEDSDEFKADTNSLQGYLLGNIVLIDQGDKKIVVDGQQRLTTLSLFAKGISSVLNERIKIASDNNDFAGMKAWSKRVGEIEKGFFILDDADQVKELKIQHDPSLGFGDYYKKLISDEIDSQADNSAAILKTEDKNVDTVYAKIYEFLIDLKDDQLNRFIQYFKTKIKIIVTCAPTEAKAFQLFEILNDRGKTLEPMDLIKNYFLKRLTEDAIPSIKISDFNKDWQGMMANLELTSKRRISSSTFLKHYLIAFKGINLKAEKLFEYIKDNKSGFDGATILDLVANMNRVSKVYREIELENYGAFLDDLNMFIVFKMFGIRQFHPLLMPFYMRDDSEKRRILDCITRLGAAVLFSYTQTNYIEKLLPDYINTYWKNVETDATKATDELINQIKKTIRELAPIVKSNLEVRNFVGKQDKVHSKALMLLEFIELYFNKNTKVYSVPAGKTLTVEHILSRNLDMSTTTLADLGFEDETDRKNYLHRLGNLTLLYNTDNASVGNGQFCSKRDAYKNVDFVMTSTLVTPVVTSVKNGIDSHLFTLINKYEKQYDSPNGQWTKQLIDERGKDLAKFVEYIVTGDYSN